MDYSNTLLVVDDEIGILETYKYYLCPEKSSEVFRTSRREHSQRGEDDEPPEYRLLLAENGERAVDLVHMELEQGRRVAAGFFDMKMPGGIDGMETIRRLRELDKDILCTVVTAFQDRSIDDINQQFIGGHEDEWDYLNKPFTQNEIRQKARNLVASWNRRRREEEQRRDLTRLIEHLSKIKGLQDTDLADLFEYILRQLIKFTESHGGFVISMDSGSDIRVGAGSLTSNEAMEELLNKREISERIEKAKVESIIERVRDVSIVPFICMKAPRVLVLLHCDEISDERKKLVYVFAEAASTALDNHLLFKELRDLNATLDERVSQRTAELDETNKVLEEKTGELQHMLKTLKEAQQQLVQNEKLAAIGQLAAGVAHEINNPATYVLANLRELEEFLPLLEEYHTRADSGEDPERLRAWAAKSDFLQRKAELPQIASESIDGIERITEIVRELKEFGRVDKDESTKISVEEMLDRCLRILENELRHRTEVMRDYGSPGFVVGNKGKLLQVFINLIMNSMQALKHPTVRENKIEIATTTEEDCIAISFSDNGKGIEPENLEHVFEPFFTTKTGGKGMGLGLAISKDIIEQHGGGIDIESSRDAGTRVTVRLPVASGPAQEEERPHSQATLEEPKRKLSLLFVDDDPRVLKAHQRRYRGRYEVHVSEGGNIALAMLESTPEFDVVLSDLMMPEMSGIEFYQIVSKKFPHLKDRFIFLTGGAFTRKARSFLRQHSTRCLDKPFEDAKLYDMIRQVVES